jgi:hypothetical protein
MNNKNEEASENKFLLNKNKENYTLTIEKIDDSIYIKCMPYQVKFDKFNLSELFSINLNDVNEEYKFICNLFINNKVEIHEIVINSHIILRIKLNKTVNNIVYIYLIHPSQNHNFIINKYYNKLKNIENNNSIKEIKNIKNLSINKVQLNFIKSIEAYSINPYKNSFIIFNSPLSSIQYLVFATKEKNIISYDLNSNKVLTRINQSEDIMRFEYIFDKKNRRDLLMAYNLLNYLKIYDIKNWNIILKIDKVNNLGVLHSACFLHYIKENEYFIITSNDNYFKPDYIKVYDLKGNIKQEIKNSNENTFCVKTFNDESNSKTFIIAMIKNDFIKSYDFDNNTLYKKYSEKGIEGYSNMEITKTKEGIIKLITSCAAYGLILIWNFNSGILLNKIITGEKFFTFFLYNEKILFIGTMKGDLILMDLLSQDKKNIKNIHENYINCINNFIHKTGENCLVTQGNDNIIKIYKILFD